MEETKRKIERYSVCACGEPLVGSMHVPKAELYCVECGRSYGLFGARSTNATPELDARYEELREAFDENVAGKLIIPRSWKLDTCERCSDPSVRMDDRMHEKHATAEEWEADSEARQWMADRIAA